MPTHEGTGDMRKGGFWVHYRDPFNRCCHAFVTAVLDDRTLNLQIIHNGPEQLSWRPKMVHGAGKEQWHFPDQCSMTNTKMRENESLASTAKATAA